MSNKEPKGKAVYKHLRSRNVPEVAAKAMVANVAVESGYTFDSSVQQKGDRTDPAYGLFQFDPRGKGLDKPYQKYLKDTEKTDSMEAQLDFFVDSVYGNYKPGKEHMGYGNVNKFKKAAEEGDIEKATKEFSSKLLRPGKPHMDRRVNAAKNINQYIGKAEEELQFDKFLTADEDMRAEEEFARMAAQKEPEGGQAVQAAAQMPLEGAPGQMNPAVFREGMRPPQAQGEILDPFRNMPQMQGMMAPNKIMSF